MKEHLVNIFDRTTGLGYECGLSVNHVNIYRPGAVF